MMFRYIRVPHILMAYGSDVNYIEWTNIYNLIRTILNCKGLFDSWINSADER